MERESAMSLYPGNPPLRRDRAGSGFQEPSDAGPQAWSARGFRNRTDPSRGDPLRAFSQATVSGYWEPNRTGDQEPRITGYSGPRFVVTGTDSRGFRNRRPEIPLCFQSLGGLSTTLNALTSFYNRISLNAAAAKTPGKTPPLGGFAPAGSSASLRPRYALPPGIPQGFALLSTPPEGARNVPRPTSPPTATSNDCAN